jgi:hypothetical protein
VLLLAQEVDAKKELRRKKRKLARGNNLLRLLSRNHQLPLLLIAGLVAEKSSLRITEKEKKKKRKKTER